MNSPTRPNPEPLFAKRERQAEEAKSAWVEYEARQAAIEANTQRLRALRPAREAQQAPAPALKKKKARA